MIGLKNHDLLNSMNTTMHFIHNHAKRLIYCSIILTKVVKLLLQPYKESYNPYNQT